MEIYKNKYFSIEYFKESSHVVFTWFAETELMSQDEYKEGLLKTADLVEKYRPTKMLLDNTLLKFTVFPEVQQWTAEHIFKRTIAVGLVKNAIVESEEIIAELSIEQTYEESIAKTKQVRQFGNKAEALKWLLAE